MADAYSGNIYEFTPDGERSTFASGGCLLVGWPSIVRAISSNGLGSGNIYKFTPSGVRTTFAPTGWEGILVMGVSPLGLAFDSAGNLFVGNDDTLAITSSNLPQTESQSTFVASGLTTACGLAFNSAGDLFEADWGSGNIYEFTPDGTRSTFASGLVHPIALAFQPVPELTAIVTNGVFQLAVSMPSPYYSTIIQASSDLVNWINIYTNTPPFTFTDTMASNFACRYYRALLGP